MTWKDALIKLESTINFYNYQIQSLKIENDKLSNELKELKEESRPSIWKKTYNQQTHNQVFINSDGNILLYEHNVKMASFYELHHREFMFDIDDEIYAPIEKAYSYGELLKLAKTCDIECKKVYELKKELKEYQIVIDMINQYLNQSEKENNPEAFLYGIECTLKYMGMRKKETET